MYYLDVTPVAKPRMTQKDKYNPSKAAQRYWAYKDELVLKARLARFEIGPAFRAIFLMPMPKSWTKKKRRQMVGQPHQQKPDTDNLLKALKDALLVEDSHVWDEQGIKVWTDGPGGIFVENIKFSWSDKTLMQISKLRRKYNV